LLAALGQAQDASTKERIGRLLVEYGSPRRSADVFRELIRDRDVEAYAGLGAAELAQDDYVATRNAFENPLRLDPWNEDTRRQLKFTNRVLAFDPNAPGIRASERCRRSEQLLQGAIPPGKPSASIPAERCRRKQPKTI
jgi:hypothetical protein